MTVVKSGDKHAVKWRANLDLTGATVRLLIRPVNGGDYEALPCSITDAATGEVTHMLDGTLPIDRYRVELEVTKGGDVITFPNDDYAKLQVIPDLD